MSAVNLLAEKKMTKAVVALVLSHPFWGALCLRTRIAQDPTCETAWCNGKMIGYNPKFIEKMALETVQGLLIHELLHKMFFHHLRRGNREPKKWNVACDYAINPIVEDTPGARLPSNGCIDPKYKGLSAEAIYTMLPIEPPGDGEGDDKGSGNDPGGCGEVRDADGSGGSQAEQEAKIKQEIAGALHAAKMQGKMPAGIERMCEELLEPQVPWKDVLRRFMTEKAPSDYSWSRPNRRMLSSGFYFPSMRADDVCGPVVVGIDTSGSIGAVELEAFGGELNAILQDVQPSSTHVLYCDAAVAAVEVYDRGEDLSTKKMNPAGGGGTDFRPVFEYIRENDLHPRCVIYITDGYGSFPDENEVDSPVMWVMTTDVVAPVGETLPITL